MKITKSQLKEMIREELKNVKQEMNEYEVPDVKLPSKIMRFADKMIDSIKRVNLTRRKQLFLLNYVINGLGLDLQRLRMYTQKIKRGMGKRGEDESKY